MPQNQAPDSIELRSPRLRVRLALPGSSYRSTRFDHSSFVVGLELDGRHQFASAERDADHPLHDRGGQGLSCEFGIRTPIGYADCPVGDWFPKLGVGFLRRESAAEYDFFHHYAECRPLAYRYDAAPPADAPAGAQAYSITGTAAETRGYAWEMTRTWLVHGNCLENRCILRNTGRLPLETTEYCHNFVKLGSGPVGPDYRLEFGFPVVDQAPDHADPCGDLDGRRPVIAQVPKGEYYLGRLAEGQIPAPWWRLSSAASGLSIREDLSLPCVKCDLWGKSSVISPELFAAVAVPPGGSLSWARRYTLAS